MKKIKRFYISCFWKTHRSMGKNGVAYNGFGEIQEKVF